MSPIRKDVLASIVFIERSALPGKSPTQIGDCIAMRALGGTRPQNDLGARSILSLFTPGATEAPPEMTAFDRGYLRGLYADTANAFATTTQSLIVRSILEEKKAEGMPDIAK
ncbi:hypothetical protein [Sphingomonas sp. 22176]|uniref:hypothetical protein n=1 Tax=Sphingomonas sp. 22176 TaxID=3453884 RepID=UPI003F8782EC